MCEMWTDLCGHIIGLFVERCGEIKLLELHVKGAEILQDCQKVGVAVLRRKTFDQL